jgi:radical SAM superfamily enzyme YgiQ (UPF0313 family)/ubiquinone/menaquinone biosynthesis C-methylase UbiE
LQKNNRILLIQPHSPRINFAIPLGLAYIAAVVKNHGYYVKVIDATAPYCRGGLRYILKEFYAFKPKIVGITLNTLFIGFAYDLITELKKANITVIAGGPHATLLPQEVLDNGVDVVVRGEAEDTIAELINFLDNGYALNAIKGISFRGKDGQIINNPARSLTLDLDRLPFPAKETFDIAAYVRNDFELWRYAGLITSRGCIGNCSFCSKRVFGERYRMRSIDSVLDELIFLNRKYGLRNFHFLDDVFTADKNRIYLLCEKLKSSLKFDFGFTCITRFDCIDKELLKKMRETGCSMINYGVESANPLTLQRLNKSEAINEMIEKIRWTKEEGINCSINFMWGYPWESIEEMHNTVNLMRELSKFAFEIMPAGILIPFPGTQLYEEYKDEYGFQQWWLQRKRFTGNYRLDSYVSLYRHYLFDDQGQFKGGGFFNKSKKEWDLIKTVAGYIGWHNLRNRNSLCLFLVYGLLCKISQSLYSLNARLDHYYSRVIFSLIAFKNRLSFKKDVLKRMKRQKSADEIDAHYLDYYSQISYKYDESRFGHKSGRVFDEMEKRLINKMLGDNLRGRLLDVATGTARIALNLSRDGLKIVGIDQAIEMLKKAEDKKKGISLSGRLDFVTGAARLLPFKNESFDAVVSIRFLTGVPPEALCFYVNEMKRVLKPGGILLLEFSNRLDLREFIKIKNRRRFPWPWQIEMAFKGLEIVDRKAFWFAGQRRVAAYSKRLSFLLGKLGRIPPFYYLASQIIIKAKKPIFAEQLFLRRKKELLEKLQLNPLRILRSRIHCEVIKCRDKDGDLVVLKILKCKNQKNKREFNKETNLIKNYIPDSPLRFPEYICSGDDYHLTKFVDFRKIDFNELDEPKIELIVKSLQSLHKLRIEGKEKDPDWNSGIGYFYFFRLSLWLMYLMWEYVGFRKTLTFLTFLLRNFKYIKKYSVITHGSFELGNMLFAPENKFLALFDFEYFSLSGNLWFDVVFLCCDSGEYFGDWSWQKTLIKRYLGYIQQQRDFNLDKKQIMVCMRIAFLHSFIRRMIVQRIYDERDRLFPRMSGGYIFSRILSKIYRLISRKPIKFSENMNILKTNFDKTLDNDSFEEFFRQIMA